MNNFKTILKQLTENEEFGYIAGFNGKTIEIYAESKYQAQLKAEKIFKPSKKDKGLIWVELAEKDGKTVTHIPVD